MATQTLSNDDIIEAIGNLSVVELAELIEKFKEKFGELNHRQVADGFDDVVVAQRLCRHCPGLLLG